MQISVRLFVSIIFVLGLSFCVNTNNSFKSPQTEKIKEDQGKEGMLKIQASDDILSTINRERAKRGLKTLSTLLLLNCAAQTHANDIGTRKVCTHTGRDGSSFVTRAKRCGYSLTSGGEIVACGQTSAKAAVDAWIKSPGHYAIMMDSNQKYFGAGEKNNYRVVVFSKK